MKKIIFKATINLCVVYMVFGALLAYKNVDHQYEYVGGLPEIIKDYAFGWGLIVFCNTALKDTRLGDMLNPLIITKLWTVNLEESRPVPPPEKSEYTFLIIWTGRFQSFWSKSAAIEYANRFKDRYGKVYIENEWTGSVIDIKPIRKESS